MISLQDNLRSQISQIHPWLVRSAHTLGIGRALTRIQQLRALTLTGAIAMNLNRWRYLKRILDAQPIPSINGALEVHMLLNHARIYEGLWSLYSFSYFYGQPCCIVVHDDGTLSGADTVALRTLFPGCQVISRRLADSIVMTSFEREGLARCARLRDTLIFALKLFDPFFFAQSHWLIMLDSDVLFFAQPVELFTDGCDAAQDVAQTSNLYSYDNGYRYCLAPKELAALAGRECIERFNPGVVRIRNGSLDFRRIERYLQHPGFWKESGQGNYYAELTLWALELTLAGANALPDTYAICPNASYHPNAVSGHYCGGGYWASLFYTRGLSKLARTFLRRGRIGVE